MKEETALRCDDCNKEFKSIFDICDYADLELKHHCVCPKCIASWVEKVGDKKAKELISQKLGIKKGEMK